MMIENHVRHIKPFESERSVIWASRIGLLLLLIVMSVAVFPFIAQQVQNRQLTLSNWKWQSLNSTLKANNIPRFELLSENLMQMALPQEGYLYNQQQASMVNLFESLQLEKSESLAIHHDASATTTEVHN